MAGITNIQVRHDIRPGDLGRMLHLHGVVYAQESGFDLTFEGAFRVCRKEGRQGKEAGEGEKSEKA